jgi:hypothetical protein
MAKGKLNMGINYRHVNYNYSMSDTKTLQNIAELNLNWVIMPKLSVSMYFEGTFEQQSNRVLTPQIAGHNLKNKLGLIKFGNYGKNETKIYT